MIVIEHDIELENKIGIAFERLSYFIEKTRGEEQKFNIYGEFSMDNYEIYESISFEAVFYDEKDDIIYVSYRYCDLNNVLGHMSVQFFDYLSLDIINRIKKIKVYPKSAVKHLTQNQIKPSNRITLENEDLLVKIFVKKDYSLAESFTERRNEFCDDIINIIDKFTDTKEFKNFMKNHS